MQKYTLIPRLLSQFSIAFFVLLLILLFAVPMLAGFVRNVGAVYLLDYEQPDALSTSKTWLTWSNEVYAQQATYRLEGKRLQLSGEIGGAIQEWQNAGLVRFAIDTGLRQIAVGETEHLSTWEDQMRSLISHPADWRKLASALQTQKRYERAVDAYQIAIDLAKQGGPGQVSLSEIHYGLAQIYESHYQDNSRALEEYQSAVESSDFENTWHAVTSYQKLAILLIKENSSQAVTYARRAVDLMPTDALSHSILGLTIYSASGDLHEAENSIRTAIQLTPQNVWPWMHLGQLYFQAGHYQSAVEAYQRAAELNPQLQNASEMVSFITENYLKK